MRAGHRTAQRLFEELGRSQGFEPARSYTRKLPTDGVWLLKRGLVELLPIVAIEVIVSESPKTVKGSIHTLELVSPALGVLLLENEEIWRRRIRNGDSHENALTHTARLLRELAALANQSRQRIEVWTVSQLRTLHGWGCGTRAA